MSVTEDTLTDMDHFSVTHKMKLDRWKACEKFVTLFDVTNSLESIFASFVPFLHIDKVLIIILKNKLIKLLFSLVSTA